MAKVAEVQDEPGYYIFDCPGCNISHFINTNPNYGPIWDFDKDLDNPTVSPSLLVRIPWKDEIKICHSFVKEGKIQFLDDCTHALAGQTVDLPEMQ